MKKIIHIDMDCFYAAVEMRDDPSLENQPMAVGGTEKQRGVLCTSNYAARKFGVRSAMATAAAKRLCPNLIVLPPNMEKYKLASNGIRDIFHDYTDLVEPLSLDEAYLDVSDCKKQQGSATLIAKEIRERIFQSQSLKASAGIAPNKFLAKIASDWNKPNGQFVILPRDVEAFVKVLPVEKIFGVGKVTAKKLHKLGILTCHDVYAFGLNNLTESFGKFGQHLFNLSSGIDDREVNPNYERKSLSVEHTFSEDVENLEACLAEIAALFQNLMNRLDRCKEKIPFKQIIKLKFCDFQQTTVETRIEDKLSLELFKDLLRRAYSRQKKPVRLIGLGVGFKSEDSKIQQVLF